MKKLFLFCAVLVSLIYTTTFSQTIEAKIGVLSMQDGKYYSLLNNDFVKIGQPYLILILPEIKVFAYVLFSDDKTTTLLTDLSSSASKDKVVLPGVDETYTFKQSKTHEVSIILSKRELKELTALFNKQKDVARTEYDKLQNEIMDDLVTNNNYRPEDVKRIGGNVRMLSKKERDQLLPKYSSKGVIFKKYSFETAK